MLARRRDDRGRAEVGLGGEIGRGDSAIGLPVRSAISTMSGAAVSSGRSAMRRASASGTPALGKLRGARGARGRSLRRQRAVERRGNLRRCRCGNARRRRRGPLRDRRCAGTRPGGRAAGPAPRRRVELHLARHLAVERVDLVVERRHVVAVAHRGEGRGDVGGARRRSGRRCARQRRPAAVDHRIGELRRDDLAAQPVLLQRVGNFCAITFGK